MRTTSSLEATSKVKGSRVRSPYRLLVTFLPALFSDANSFRLVVVIVIMIMVVVMMISNDDEIVVP
jgi:hypothetical protein